MKEIIIIQLSILTIACTISLFQFRNASATYKVIGYFLSLSLVLEILSTLSLIYLKNNIFIYNVSSFVAFVFISSFYYWFLGLKRFTKVIAIINSMAALLMIFRLFFTDMLYTQFNQDIIIISTVGLLCYSFHFWYRIDIRKKEYEHFFLAFGFSTAIVVHLVVKLNSWIFNRWYRTVPDDSILPEILIGISAISSNLILLIILIIHLTIPKNKIRKIKK